MALARLSCGALVGCLGRIQPAMFPMVDLFTVTVEYPTTKYSFKMDVVYST